MQKANVQKEYAELNRQVKKNVRRNKREWIEELAQKAEEAERIGDTKQLYGITKKLSKKGFKKHKPIRNDKGEMLSSLEEQLNTWREYFAKILNKD